MISELKKKWIYKFISDTLCNQGTAHIYCDTKEDGFEVVKILEKESKKMNYRPSIDVFWLQGLENGTFNIILTYHALVPEDEYTLHLYYPEAKTSDVISYHSNYGNDVLYLGDNKNLRKKFYKETNHFWFVQIAVVTEYVRDFLIRMKDVPDMDGLIIVDSFNTGEKVYKMLHEYKTDDMDLLKMIYGGKINIIWFQRVGSNDYNFLTFNRSRTSDPVSFHCFEFSKTEEEVYEYIKPYGGTSIELIEKDHVLSNIFKEANDSAIFLERTKQ